MKADHSFKKSDVCRCLELWVGESLKKQKEHGLHKTTTYTLSFVAGLW